MVPPDRRPPPRPDRAPAREQGPDPTGDPPPLRRPTFPGIPGTHAKPPSRPGDTPDDFEIEVPVHGDDRPSRAKVEPPQRQRAGSVPDDIDPFVLYRLDKLDDDVSRIESKVDGQGIKLADVEKLLAESGKRETGQKALFAFLTVLVSTLGTVLVTVLARPTPAPTEPVQRSAFDRALDACAKLESDSARGTCIGRVIDESMPARR